MKCRIRSNYLSLRLFVLAILCSAGTLVFGQVKISGVVKDNTGDVLIGATILEEGTTNGVATNAMGEFSLDVNPNSRLVVQYIGYETVTVNVGSQRFFEIIMDYASETFDELIVIGYGVQQKATLTGSVSAITNDEIITTKNENLQNMLTGKIAGLRVVQNSSEPGLFNTSMDIRGYGAPLIIIDGVPRNNMARLNPEDIESISVIKDATASVYGSRAANGVVIITTKKGTSTGESSISYSGVLSWQRPSNYPELVGAADWMTLYNEKMKHNVDNSTVVPRYSQEEIDEYRNGIKQSVNWREKVMRNSESINCFTTAKNILS